MSTIILVGPESPLLRILGVVLSRVATVHLAHEDEALRSMLSVIRPHLVIFEHDDPADLFLMNPRRFGFAGPLLLLTHDIDPMTAIDLLEADYWLRRPIDVGLVEDLVRRLAVEQMETDEQRVCNN